MDNDELRNEIHNFIDENLVDGDPLVVEAARYVSLASGHRWRPLITLRTVEAFNGDLFTAMPLAVAGEYAHLATVIDDDLPCMDNQDLRKGKLTCHKQFGEDIAVLVQLYLIGKLIRLDTGVNLSDNKVRKILGVRGQTINYLVSGQKKDLRDLKNINDLEQVIEVYRLKTGSLMGSASVIGGIACGAGEEYLKSLDNFGNFKGVAYQIRDDVYDVMPGELSLGKSKGQDHGKNTLIRLLGVDEAIGIADRYDEMALEELRKIDGLDTKGLEELVIEMRDSDQNVYN